MAITDNLVLKVQPAAGDTYIKNLITVEDVAATGAGTIALVDDAGLMGWKVMGARKGAFTGGVNYEGATVTFAARFKVNARGADFLQMLALYNNAADGSAFGPQVTNNGTATGALRVRETIGASGFTVVGAPAYTTGQYITLVMRYADNGAGNAKLDVFLKQTGRASNVPDYSVTEGVTRTRTGIFSQLLIGAAGTDLTLVDAAAWMRGVTDAEGAALADDLRGTLDGTAGTSVSSDLAATYNIESAGTLVSSDLAASYGVAAYVSANLAASYSVAGTPVTGSFVTDVWINNAGTPRGAVAVSYTWVGLGRIGSLTGKTLTEGTATLSAGSTLTATGWPLGAGFLLGAVLGSDATTDDVYYEAGTVT